MLLFVNVADRHPRPCALKRENVLNVDNTVHHDVQHRQGMSTMCTSLFRATNSRLMYTPQN